MGKRDGVYDNDRYESVYPDQGDQITKRCELCGAEMVVNNWPDRKSRTPRFKSFIVCVSCDPRHPDDRYEKEGYRILWPGRLRVIRFAQVTRALARKGCMKNPDGRDEGPCKCPGCAAMKLFPNG